MNVAVWGAGEIGRGLSYRLVTCDFVSRLFWINRSYDKIAARVIDLEHGLALAPCCTKVQGTPEEFAAEVLADTELVVLTQGSPVPLGGSREDVFAGNVGALGAAVGALKGYRGVVLVISNPVDALARVMLEKTGLPEERIFGLGTVVETMRLRAAVAGHIVPELPARAIWCFAIGTHDANVLVVRGPLGVGLPLLDSRIWASIEHEVVAAPQRVKADGKSTLHAVVESAIAVARAVANDSGDVFTVSVRDETGAFFSVPVSLGRAGVLGRHVTGIPEADISRCRALSVAAQDVLMARLAGARTE